MDAERIAEIRARVEAATNDRGLVYDTRDDDWLVSTDKPIVRALIPAVRDLRDLLAEVERLTAERDALAAQVAEQAARAEEWVEAARQACLTRDAHAATIERVRELHRESRGAMSALYPMPICECGQDYPCLTVRALDGGVA